MFICGLCSIVLRVFIIFIYIKYLIFRNQVYHFRGVILSQFSIEVDVL